MPSFTNEKGERKFKDYRDLVINFETAPGSGIGFLGGWRGKSGEKSLKGEPNPNQWEMYEKNNCVFHYEMPKSFPVHAKLEQRLFTLGARAQHDSL